MAYDKVVDSAALDGALTGIADAIRGKTGGTEKLTLDGMAAAIASITGGSGGGNETEVITLASGFSNAQKAYEAFLNFTESGETTFFVRKTEGTYQNACLLVFVNMASSSTASAVARWRDNTVGVVPVSTVYDAIANAGDEYYKVVLK